MKKITKNYLMAFQVVLSFFIFYPFSTTYAQNTKAETEFLTWFFTKEHKKTLTYIPDYAPYNAQELKNYFQRDTMINLSGNSSKKKTADLLILSKQDREQIDKQLKVSTPKDIPGKILPHMKMITREQIKKYFSNGSDGWGNMNIDKISGYYSFTRPIFLRNNTICIFEYGYSCGYLCGNGNTAIYKKEDGQWKQWMALSSWIS